MSFIKSPLNYTGGKYKILPPIFETFPDKVGTFVDLFAGGFNVGINVDADKIICNDHINYLIELYQFFADTDIDKIIAEINARIQEFSLDLQNAEGYDSLRNRYNESKNIVDLFVLTCYSFNHQIRFNNSQKFNTPFGRDRSRYNSSIENNLRLFCDALKKKNIEFSNKDFLSIDLSGLGEDDLVYCDPPYLISTGTYNDGKRGFKDWTMQEERQLLELLERLDSQGVKFALSNVLYHKGLSNDLLIEWSKKYNVFYIDKTYANCSYQFKNKNAQTVEVVITNFEKRGMWPMTAVKSFLDKDTIVKKLADAGVEDIDGAIKELESEVKRFIKRQEKLAQPYVNEEYDNASLFVDVYPEYDVSKLPSWVNENIETAKVIGNTKQTVILADGRRYQLNNTLNHMSGGEWTYFTNSVINTAYKTSGEDSFAHKIRKIHPTPKPPQLMRDIIEFFTKENELVVDYFMGVGGSLLGAGVCGRRAVGIDLNADYIDAYKRAAKEIGCPEFKCVEGDCLEILSDADRMKELLDGEEVSLVLIDPPYGNMMSREKTGADIKIYGNVATPFTESDKDLGNLDLNIFFDKLKESVENVLPYIKKRGHVVIFIKDLQPSGKETNLLHAKIIDKLNEIPNLNYKGLKIWADQTAKLFPYGYPFSFVANQIHQYILVFRKEK